MNLFTLVWRELWERKNQLMTSFLAIALGAAAIVAVHSIAYYSEKMVKQNLDALGANILILPGGAAISDYYSADIDGPVMSEDILETMRTAGLEGLDNMSPKLSARLKLDDRDITLTGILPKNEIIAKSVWGGVSTFNPLASCENAGARQVWKSEEEKLTQQRFVEELGKNEVFLGADVAAAFKKSKGDSLKLMGREFKIRSVLPATGTVDDGRIFGHLSAAASGAGTDACGGSEDHSCR